MKLHQLKPNDTAVLKLKHPVTGDELEGVEITLCGSDSEKFRSLQKDAAREAISKKTQKIDFEKLEEKTIERLAALTVSIVGLEDEDGKPISATTLYTDYKWAREQVDVFIMERQHFLPNA